jgi:hypothetical protein
VNLPDANILLYLPKGAIDLVNVHDVEYINVLNVEERPGSYRPSARQSRSALCRLLVIAASAGNFL